MILLRNKIFSRKSSFMGIVKASKKVAPKKEQAQRAYRHLKDGTLDEAADIMSKAKARGKATKEEVQRIRDIAKNQRAINGDKGKASYISSTKNGKSTTLTHTPRDKKPGIKPGGDRGPDNPGSGRKGINPNHSTSVVRQEEESIKEKLGPHSYLLERSKVRANGNVETKVGDVLSMFPPGQMSSKK